MSKYTTTIYNILKNIVPDSDSLTLDDLIIKGVPLFFDFDFPWYTDAAETKEEFEKMYLTCYLNNEIGQETLGHHKQCIRRMIATSVEEMRQKYDLLTAMNNVAGERRVVHNENVNEAESSNMTNDQTAKGTSKQNDKQNSQAIHSDNPQVTFAQNDYASTMDRAENVTDSSVDSSTSTNNESDSTRTGNTVRKLTEIETDTRNSDKYFNAIASGVYLINTELIERCRRLFMLLW